MVNFERKETYSLQDLIEILRILRAPGMQLQRLTTAEPDDSMLEVAIRALELVIPEEKGKDAW